MASTHQVHAIFVLKRWCKFSLGRQSLIFSYKLGPLVGIEVEKPSVIEIVKKLTSEHNQIVINQLCPMVRSLPGDSSDWVFREIAPLICGQIKWKDCIKFLLIKRSSSEDDHPVKASVIVHGHIGAWRWDLSSLLYLLKPKCVEVECPQIVVVLRVLITAEKVDSIAD